MAAGRHGEPELFEAMIHEPLRLKEPPPDVVERLMEIERNFQVRKFGEELARVNLDMTQAQRLAYLGWMRSHARRHGVLREPNYSVAWMLKLEARITIELAF